MFDLTNISAMSDFDLNAAINDAVAAAHQNYLVATQLPSAPVTRIEQALIGFRYRLNSASGISNWASAVQRRAAQVARLCIAVEAQQHFAAYAVMKPAELEKARQADICQAMHDQVNANVRPAPVFDARAFLGELTRRGVMVWAADGDLHAVNATIADKETLAANKPAIVAVLAAAEVI